VLPAAIVPRSAVAMRTTRLADALGPLVQVWCVAAEVSEAEAVPAVSAVPDVWPVV
jgi:hypothetical protein